MSGRTLNGAIQTLAISSGLRAAGQIWLAGEAQVQGHGQHRGVESSAGQFAAFVSGCAPCGCFHFSPVDVRHVSPDGSPNPGAAIIGSKS